MFFEESNVEGDASDDDDDSEIQHSSDDFETSYPSAAKSPSALLGNTSSVCVTSAFRCPAVPTCAVPNTTSCVTTQKSAVPTSTISSHNYSIGKTQKRKYNDGGSECL